MSKHTDKAFEKDLRDLRELLLNMGARVESAISRSVRSLKEGDSRLAERVVAEDAEVDRLEVHVDDRCRKTLALRQPAASDLRLIPTALKIVNDLERCGDLAVNIAERVIDVTQAPPLPQSPALLKLAELAYSQLNSALAAFVAEDPEAAQHVLQGDHLLDALY